MRHAKIGDSIKILDDNSGDWVKVGTIYTVIDVDASDVDYEKVYVLEGVANSWYAEPRHFKIIDKDVALTHPRYYSRFKEGDVVCRWRDVEQWEWEGIGDIDLPELGDPITVDNIDVNNKHKEDSFENGYHGWFPMKAFVLAEYYNNTITNLGTGVLNTTDHGKINQGRTIEVQRSTASIVTGQRRTGSRIQGRRDAAVVGLGHLGYKAITGK